MHISSVPAAHINSAASSIRGKGFRFTPQRRLIFQILDSADTHLDAEGIWTRAHQQNAEINLATVYRTLGVLVRSGLVQQSYLGEGQKRAYYEVLDKPPHIHFACLRCGAVLELESDLFGVAQRELERREGVRIQKVHLKFEGLCTDCVQSEQLNNRETLQGG